MIIVCPLCHNKLRIDAKKYYGKKLLLNCRHCASHFSHQIPPLGMILVAHGEADVCQSILDICRDDVDRIVICRDARGARHQLSLHPFAVFLLDVALPGAFLFELVDEVQGRDAATKIILLPSVYNRTAYKRKPSSLYGADAYLELHHLPDRLIPLLKELGPALRVKSLPRSALAGEGAERNLPPGTSVNVQAETLARMLIADIALYHQDQIDLGIEEGNLEERLAEQLAEGRRMLSFRIPQTELDAHDYLLIALKKFAMARENELFFQKGSPHG